MTRRDALLSVLAFGKERMVRLPGGTFQMGADEATLLQQFPKAGPGLRAMLLAESPRHQVTVPPFWIDRYEVTNREYQEFVIARPEWDRRKLGGNYLLNWVGDHFPEGQGDFPVVHVSWQAAMAYASWAGKRLPAEAEWEFAARGGQAGAKYPWGNEDASPGLANYSESGKHAPVRVGRSPAGRSGVFDLAGNVWEFCLDAWPSPYPSHALEFTEAGIAALGKTSAERRVIRGGSYDGGAFNMRVTARDSHRADDPVGHVGFRCAMGG
ncbi:MAG: SUMF1/EgtB/PvdO family nonheme iron enzyme [Bryobacteraceae bacterium]|nr:SUMF1/EgtB/PvdO family nonheme iron enzyme [Bryobacteraceae bacterium]